MMRAIAKHRLTSLIGLASIFLVLGGFFWAYGMIGPGAGTSLGAPLILHFNDMEGITAVGGFVDVIYMAILGLLMILIDIGAAFALEERDPVLAKVLSAAGLVLAVLLFIAFTVIINVN